MKLFIVMMKNLFIQNIVTARKDTPDACLIE